MENTNDQRVKMVKTAMRRILVMEAKNLQTNQKKPTGLIKEIIKILKEEIKAY